MALYSVFPCLRETRIPIFAAARCGSCANAEGAGAQKGCVLTGTSRRGMPSPRCTPGLTQINQAASARSRLPPGGNSDEWATPPASRGPRRGCHRVRPGGSLRARGLVAPFVPAASSRSRRLSRTDAAERSRVASGARTHRAAAVRRARGHGPAVSGGWRRRLLRAAGRWRRRAGRSSRHSGRRCHL